MIYATGDTHGNFQRFAPEYFPEQAGMTKEDYMIICGDFGGVWDGGKKEERNLDWLEDLPFTTLFISGNHENFDLLSKYPTEEWNGGTIQRIRPHVIHLMRGQVFDLQGCSFFTMGGARSHDIEDGILNPKAPDFEEQQLGWDIKRNLAKINYRIHTDAIKENLIPPELSAKQISMVYASEADVLNMALFGMTAKQWRDSHPELKGNIRDYANVSQLVCLSNLENLNAVFISEGMSQAERLAKLNAIAISQMEILTQDHRIEALEAHSGELSPRE